MLTVNGTNVLTPPIAPHAKRLNGLFVFDHLLDGTSDLSAPIPSMAALPFLSGADLHLPATNPPSTTIRTVLTPRGGGEPNVINVPAWPSTTNHSTIQYRDFTTPGRAAPSADRGCPNRAAPGRGSRLRSGVMPVRAVTFDADDTLWDFSRARDEALALAIRLRRTPDRRWPEA